VIEKKKERLKSQILNHLAVPKTLDQYRDFAASLLAENNPEDVVAALLAHSYSDELNTQSYKTMEEVSVDTTGVSRLFIALGRVKGYDARKLVDYIMQVSGVENNEINDVRVMDDFSFVTVPFAAAELIIRSFDKIKDGGRSLVSKAKDKSSSG
jgi:ATP-dependent RNA helicase DeaD